MYSPLKAILIAIAVADSFSCVPSPTPNVNPAHAVKWLYISPGDMSVVSRFPHNSLLAATTFEAEEKRGQTPGEKHPGKPSYNQFKAVFQPSDSLFTWAGGGLDYPASTSNQARITPTGLCILRDNKIIAICITGGWSVLECELK